MIRFNPPVPDGIEYELLRFRTRDGDETTVYLTRHPRASTRLALKCFSTPTRLDHWCAAERHPEAIVAGFFVRDPYRPLGEVRLGGSPVVHEPVAEPWAVHRACVHIDGSVRLAPRGELAPEHSNEDQPAPESRPVVTALLFERALPAAS